MRNLQVNFEIQAEYKIQEYILDDLGYERHKWCLEDRVFWQLFSKETMRKMQQRRGLYKIFCHPTLAIVFLGQKDLVRKAVLCLKGTTNFRAQVPTEIWEQNEGAITEQINFHGR